MQSGLLIIAAALLVFFGTFRLSESPAIWYDEGFYTQMAVNVSERGLQVIQIAPDIFVSGAAVTAGFPLIYPVSAAYTLFGIGVTQGRITMVFFIIALALAAYVLIRKLFGAWYASWSVLLLAAFPMLYGSGKPVLGEVPGLFFLVLFLIALVFLERSSYRDIRLWAISGLAAGLSVVTKPIFLLLIPAIFVVWIIRSKHIPLTVANVALGIGAFALPVALWFFTQFGGGDSFAETFRFYANPYEETNIVGLALQNAASFFTDVTPFYLLAAVTVWGASLFIRKNKKESITAAEMVGFFFSLTIMLAFLRLPGWYRYLFPAIIPALLVAPFAGVTVYNWLQEHSLSFLRKFGWLPYAVLIVLIVGQAYQTAFSSYVADYYGGHRTEDMQNALRPLTEDESVFFYNVPELVILLPHRNYYQFLEPHPNGLIGEEELGILAKGEPDIVVATNATYTARPKLFSAYSVIKSLGRYVLLRR